MSPEDTAKATEPPSDPRCAASALPRRIHLVGIGGAGLSGAARILVGRGHEVSGSDRAESAMLEALRELEIDVALGESREEHLPDGVELVARSAAVPEDDPQVAAALARGVPVLKYAELLGRLAPAEDALAIAGTHGKTTTSWMLWHALEALGDVMGGPLPGALIGGLSRRLSTNAVPAPPGGWFVCEACEYDRSFLQLAPHAAAITNIEGEHLDYYGSLEAVVEAFGDFVSRIDPEGLLVLGPDVPEAVEARCRARVWRVGRELEIEMKGEQRGRFGFLVTGPGFQSPRIDLGVPGHFNVENAALALALSVGVAFRRAEREGREEHPDEIAEAVGRGIAGFSGVRRRFESWGRVGDVEVVHDYAHHPTEVRVTLEAARRAFPGRSLCVLFQPHQHSRTTRFFADFVECLRGADLVCVTDIYGARRQIDDVRRASSADLAERLSLAGVSAFAGGPLGRSVNLLLGELPDRSALLVLGAGDVEDVKQELLGGLALRRTAPGQSRS